MTAVNTSVDATAATAAAATADVVDRSKSESDLKQYKLLTLPNALQVLLISTKDVPRTANDESDDESNSDNDDDEDDESDESMSEGDHSDSDDDEFDREDGENGRGAPSRRAGACLTVGVGSYAEPTHLPGLAHYLEHMVFMGSAKYPNENEFESFLSAHGGFSNGSTDNEVTRYTFEVGPAHLQPALDMFAQFFIAPLLKPATLERELSAIESEFSQAMQNDRVRQQQVLCAEAAVTHPYRRFGWGNRKSLKEQPEAAGVDVHAEIRAFYDQYYSANIMKLVVCGEDSLEDMAAWVAASYSSIPNKQVHAPSFAASGQPFGASVSASPVVCRILPVRDIHTLQLDWMVPPVFGRHDQKPADYIASLLGHESEGSVLSLLKERGWISALTAGVTDTDGNDAGTYGAKFDVTMKLTLDGIAHWHDIALVVFEYLHMLQASGLPDWVFDELKALAAISFRFQEESSAVERCEELAEIMQTMYKVPPQDLLRYDLFDGPFERKLVSDMLAHLSPANVFVSLTSRTFGDDPAFTSQAREEEWFGVTYTKELVSDAIVAAWRAAGRNPKLQLPKPNPFIPRDFALVSAADDRNDSNDAAAAAHTDVTCQRFAFGSQWHKPDRQFRTPRAHIAFLFHLPSVLADVHSVVATELYVKLVCDALDEYAYHANVAELTYSLRIKESGLELVFGGFSDKLRLLIEVVVRALFKTPIRAPRFAIAQQDLLREYRNAIVKVGHKAKYLRLQLLERVAFPLDESVAALEATTPASLEAFVTTDLWRARTHVSSFAHGNISVTAAAELRAMVEADLERLSVPLAATAIPKRLIHYIPATRTGVLLEAASELATETNTQVEFYYQLGEHTVELLAYADLLEQLMDEPLFDSLRTKQELGYDVSCTVRVTHGIIGFGVMVQSSLFDATYIAHCINEFVRDFHGALDAMPTQHFRDHVQAAALKKREPDHNLLETTHRYWHEIASGRLAFDLDATLALELERCTKREMAKRYHKWFLATPRKLVVYVHGQASEPTRTTTATRSNTKASTKFPAPERIPDLYAFKRELPCYDDNTRAAFEADATRDCTNL